MGNMIEALMIPPKLNPPSAEIATGGLLEIVERAMPVMSHQLRKHTRCGKVRVWVDGLCHRDPLWLLRGRLLTGDLEYDRDSNLGNALQL